MGLNLTAASVVFHFDRWWTAAVEAQAEGRAYRMGQTRPVQVIAEIIAGKQRMSDLLVDNAGANDLSGLSLPELLAAVGVYGRAGVGLVTIRGA